MGPGVGGLARHSLSLRLTLSDDETEVFTVQDDDVVYLVPQGVSMSDSAGEALEMPQTTPPDRGVVPRYRHVILGG